MFEFIKNIFRREKTVQLRMIDINGRVTRNKWRAVVVLFDEATTVDQWYRLNLDKIKERRERWILPTFETAIAKYKGQKATSKEGFFELVGWNIEQHKEVYPEIYPLLLQVVDKMVEANDGDVGEILRTYEKFIFSVDQRAARYYPKIRKWNWIEIDKWWGYLADEAREYLGIKEEQK